MKGIVLHYKSDADPGGKNYIRFEHSDSLNIDDVEIEKATIFWPDELEPGFETELIEMASFAKDCDADHIEVKEVEVTIK